MQIDDLVGGEPGLGDLRLELYNGSDRIRPFYAAWASNVGGNMVVLGLDIGTTGVKAMAVSDSGEILSLQRREYPLLTPRPGWYELDTSLVSEQVVDAIASAAGEAGTGSVRAIAASVLGESFVPVDRHNRPLNNTIVALDHRAKAQAQEFERSVSAKHFFEVTGQALHPLATLFKINWVQEQLSEIAVDTSKYLCWNEMLSVLLGVRPAISPSLAGRTGMFDLRAGSWSSEILGKSSLSPDMLGSIVPSGEIIDTLPQSVSQRLHLAPDCCLVSGGWDQACSALGSGATAQGVAANSMGSTDSLNVTYAGAMTTEAMLDNYLTCTPAAVSDHFLTNAFSLTGGNALVWFRELLDSKQADTAEASDRYFELLVDDALSVDESVFVLPHFAGAGTPTMDSSSLGAVVGLSFASGRAHIARGILEGIAFEMAANLSTLELCGINVNKIDASGGGAKNAKSVQLRANIYGRPVTKLDLQESGCLGAAALALHALQTSTPLSDIVLQWTGEGEVFEPDPKEAERYALGRRVFNRLYPALHSINEEITRYRKGGGSE